MSCTALIVAIFEQFCCFDEVFLIALTSTEQLFIERPSYRHFLHNDYLLILFLVTCVKKFLAMFLLLQFSIFRSSHWRCSVRRGLLGNLTKFTEKTCGKVSFLIKFQAEATASDLSCVFSWRFLVTWFQLKDEIKKGNTLIEFQYLLFGLSIDLFDIKDFKEIWQMVIWSGNVFKENLLLQFSWLPIYNSLTLICGNWVQIAQIFWMPQILNNWWPSDNLETTWVRCRLMWNIKYFIMN